MFSINLIVEDRAHARFLEALLNRLADQYAVPVEIRLGSARGGHGRVISKLKEYTNDLQNDQVILPDLLIVATDGNCKGFSERKHEIDNALRGFSGQFICAIPDPHIERWLLIDSAAFKKVLGKGCSAPVQKCERDLYKRLLQEAVQQTGIKARFGGIEYTEELVHEMNLDYLERTEESLGKLLRSLRLQFQDWQRSSQAGAQELREAEAVYILQSAFPRPEYGTIL